MRGRDREREVVRRVRGVCVCGGGGGGGVRMKRITACKILKKKRIL